MVGNEIEPNQLLINNGEDRSFKSLVLPGGHTYSIALGDVNGDGNLDIVVALLDDDPNQLLINNGGEGSFKSVDLPGGNTDVRSIVLGDIDGDGMLDIVVGNRAGKS